MLNGAYLHVHYADDIREETGDRISVLGCFTGSSVMHIAEKPMQLKRLAILGSLCVPNETEIKSLRIAIHENNNLVAHHDVSHLIHEPDERTLQNGEPINLRTFSFEFLLDGIVLHEPTLFSVSAFVNDIEIKGTRLFITNE